MAACGAKAADDAVAGPPSLCDADAKVLKQLLKLDWGAGSEFKGAKGKGITGKIYKQKMEPFTGVWVKSDKIFTGMDEADYKNYTKFMAETTKEDSSVKKAENTHKNDDGTVCGLLVEFKLGMMMSNRDMHLTIKSYKTEDKPDDMKCDEVSVWKDMDPKADGFKPAPKKVVRMKVLSFSFGQQTDKGYRTVDFDNYDFGGSLPKKITDKFVGNPADFVIMAEQIDKIKKNGGKYKK